MENLEDLVHSIQFASVQSEVFAALSHGTAVLNRLNAETSIEDVEQLMEDTREAVEYQETVSNLLGGAINAEDQADIDRTISQWEEEVREDAHDARAGRPPRPSYINISSRAPRSHFSFSSCVFVSLSSRSCRPRCLRCLLRPSRFRSRRLSLHQLRSRSSPPPPRRRSCSVENIATAATALRPRR